jgi:hypothetical protein
LIHPKLNLWLHHLLLAKVQVRDLAVVHLNHQVMVRNLQVVETLNMSNLSQK